MSTAASNCSARCLSHSGILPHFSSSPSRCSIAHIFSRGLVDEFEVVSGVSRSLVNEFCRISYLVHYAALDLDFGKYCADGVAESAEPIYRYDHDIFHAAVPDLVHDAKPVFGALAAADPHAKHFFGSAELGAYGYVDGFLCYCIVLSDVEMDGIHKALLSRFLSL